MARYRAILLDVDGTLVDSNDLHAEAWKEALAHHGIDVPFERIRKLIGMGGDKVIPELTGFRDGDPEAEKLSSYRSELFKERYLPQVEPFARARELLEREKRDGYQLVIATSAQRDELDGLLERAGVADLLDEETSAEDAKHSKPDPDIVQAGLLKAGVAAHEAVMIGDTPYDVAAAKRAGVPIIAVRSGGWDDAALKGAIAIYRDVAELLDRYDESPLARPAPPW